MNSAAVKHISKSNMAYAVDENHLELILQTANSDFEKVELIIGDPFIYNPIKTASQEGWLWEGRTKPFLKMTRVYQTELHDFYRATYYTETKRNKYAFLLYTKTNVYFYGCRNLINLGPIETFKLNNKPTEGMGWNMKDPIFNLFNYFNFPYINEEDIFRAPSWVKDAIWYEIFPDRFYPGNNPRQGFLPFGSVVKGITNHQFFGGSIKGITEKIPYIKELGANAIYFTPLFESPSAHKYDTTDYFKIDPQFGTNEDFYEMVETAHEAGIKVILDAVFNHCGWEFPYFQDVVKNKKASPYYNCFFIEDEDFINFDLDEKGNPVRKNNHEPLKFKTFATTPMMPKLNTTHPLMQEYLLNVVRYWMENYHIDGWRIDVSNEVSHTFWRKFRELVKSLNPEAYIFGENWDDANAWLMGDQFDGVMNYELSYPLWQFFGNHPDDTQIDAYAFKNLINQLLVRYPTHVTPNLFNLLDSHDTMRILNRCGLKKNLLKLAFVFLFSMAGSPVIYYGTEIGLEGAHDPDNRRCMLWNPKEQDLKLYDFFHTLIQLRKEYSDLKVVDIKWHLADGDILIYQKGKLYFILYRGYKEMILPLPEELHDQMVYSLFEKQTIKLDTFLELKPYQFFIFEIK